VNPLKKTVVHHALLDALGVTSPVEALFRRL
jgi:hypothetical protein